MQARKRSLGGLAFLAAAAIAGPVLAQTENPRVLDKSCAQGDSFACANLAVLYRHGRGVEKNFPRALTLYVTACEDGNDFACGSVGDMVYRGLGIAANHENGELLLKGACRRHNEWSCESLKRLGIGRDRS